MDERKSSEEALAGASEEEWKASLSSFAPRILPCVCDPKARPSKGSGIEPGQAAKVPSLMTGAHVFCGMARWTSRPAATRQDTESWMSRKEHGILCRTGWMEGDGVIYAIDADLESDGEARLVLEVILQRLGKNAIPVRSRGSARWACLIREPGESAQAKRVIPMDSGVVEVLGRGGQLAVAGRHPSGSRYGWYQSGADGSSASLPGPAVIDAPEGTVDSVIELLSFMSHGSVMTSGDRPEGRNIGGTYSVGDPLAEWLKANADVIKVHPDGRIDLKCPWAHEHTEGGAKDKPQDATYFPAGLNGYASGGFRCLHAHSGAGGRERSLDELSAWARDRGWGGAVGEGVFEDVSQASLPQPVHVPVKGDGSIGRSELDSRLDASGWRDDAGKIASTADSIAEACLCPDCIGYDVRHDRFFGCLVARKAGETDAPWSPLTDSQLTDIRCHLERYGFKAKGMGFDVVSRCVELAGERRGMDSMLDHLSAYAPEWDGVSRWRTFFSGYCGATDDSDYLGAVGEYVGCALWERASCDGMDGVKADIVPVLIGEQGTRKSTLVKTLAMEERWTADIELDQPEAEVARACLGKVTVEVPELVGLGRRGAADLKAMISKAYDDVRPLYRSRLVRHPRRCLFVMTTNESQFLTDPTGNRRFAPVHTSGTLDIEGVIRDLPQLWAEGRELAKRRGTPLRTLDVQRLSQEATESATVVDDTDDQLNVRIGLLREAEKQPGYSRVAISIEYIMKHWLGWQSATNRGGRARDLAGKLQRLGMVSVRRLVPSYGGVMIRRCIWELKGCAPVTYVAPTSRESIDEDNPFGG